MNKKYTNHVLLAVLGILFLLLNTSPTLAGANGMTKQDFVNFIGDRPINFNAMYQGYPTTFIPNTWVTWTTFAAFVNINGDGKQWLVGITCAKPTTYNPCVGYRDQTLDQVVTTIPNDVFTTATNSLLPYLTGTQPAPAPTPIPTPAPIPIQQKTKQDFVNFIGGRPINFNAMYQGYPTTSIPNTWVTWTTFAAFVNINSDGKQWLVGITCAKPTTYNPCVGYRDQTLDQVVTTIPDDVFTTATAALAPYLS